jgi:hypothetical protein
MKRKLIATLTAILLTTSVCACGQVHACEIETESMEFTDSCSLIAFTDGTGYYLDQLDYDKIYPLTGIVTHIEYGAIPDHDLIFITCANGNEFSFYAPETDCWEEEDIASCIMNSKGTSIVYDDEVILAHYAGGIKHFERIISD